MKTHDPYSPERLNDTTDYGDCCVCGNPIIGFVMVWDDQLACTDCDTITETN